MPTVKHERAAALLAAAWESGKRVPELPADLVPATRDEAFRVQDGLVATRGRVGGWKVQPFDANGRNAAPIPASGIFDSPATMALSPLLEAIEVEVAVRIGRDLDDSGRHYTADDAREAIASLHAAMEVVGSRYADRKTVSPLAAVADLMSAYGIILGEGMSDWRNLDLATMPAALSVDGEMVGTPGGAWSTAEMVETIAALANLGTRRKRGLKSGDIVLTGARVKPFPPRVGVFEGRVGGFKPVQLTVR